MRERSFDQREPVGIANIRRGRNDADCVASSQAFRKNQIARLPRNCLW